MTTTISILVQIAMASLGMLIVAWYNGIQSPYTGDFSFKYLWKENGQAVVSSLIGISLIVALMVLVPTAGEWIKTVTGFEIKQPIDNGGAVFLGAIIYDQVRKSIKPKQPKE
jgi:hypothetical protein